ncbi:hypothetical protein N7532_011442 [Penicillium argentinense]|uniref:Protein BIG1 n=1 Tax=Penicillium argentinense TaxID=1131581 RepID=A0A9W9EIJ3_9EURO|nr:uncharacterized protein N7532_011442 [Penicillium argentinense]KAJ5082399.1 hypothetical protein N7532_011442 [Penicillium argentinense]
MVRPLCWTVAAFLLALVHPVLSYPVRISQWTKIREVADPKDRGVWKTFTKERGYSTLWSAQAELKQHSMKPTFSNGKSSLEKELPGRLYIREDFEDSSKVAVLIPVSPASVQPHQDYKEEEKTNYEPVEAAKLGNKKYGEILRHPKTQFSAIHRHETAYYSDSSLRLSTGQYISFFSYRVSFPFLKFAPVSFSSFPLPGVFTTVIVLLGMVWIAILTIGLVEFGNYLWNERESTREPVQSQDENSREEHDSHSREPREMSKMPLELLVIPGPSDQEDDHGEDASLLSSCSDSGSEAEDDYRIH